MPKKTVLDYTCTNVWKHSNGLYYTILVQIFENTNN